jgi:hypothetical protein
VVSPNDPRPPRPFWSYSDPQDDEFLFVEAVTVERSRSARTADSSAGAVATSGGAGTRRLVPRDILLQEGQQDTQAINYNPRRLLLQTRRLTRSCFMRHCDTATLLLGSLVSSGGANAHRGVNGSVSKSPQETTAVVKLLLHLQVCKSHKEARVLDQGCRDHLQLNGSWSGRSRESVSSTPGLEPASPQEF